jgi:acetate kinase
VREDGATVLSINCGSSSLKVGLYEAGGGDRLIFDRTIEGVGASPTHEAFELLASHSPEPPRAVGHRLVHGGPSLAEPVVIDDEILRRLRGAIPFAPLHLPPALEAIEVARSRLPSALQVACFDTAFHRDLPEVARRLPVTQALHDRGVRRYGFHGLSYEYIVSALREDVRGRVVIAHLGNGASLAALRDGHPVDTTMGLTPTGGVVMGTRTGDLDPGVLLFLMREGWDASAIERLVDHDGGLRGISGSSSDMRTLLAARAHDPRAALAISAFSASIRKAIGAMAATLGGLDRLVFTGGIGEHAAEVRADITKGLEYLACDVQVIPTNEDAMIARHTRAFLHV